MTSRNFPRVIEPAHGMAGSQTWCVHSLCPVTPRFSIHMLLVSGASLALCEAGVPSDAWEAVSPLRKEWRVSGCNSEQGEIDEYLKKYQ